MRLIAFLLLFLSVPAYAEEQEQERFCNVVSAHVSDGAAYQPGVDVRGNKVAAANVNQNLSITLDPIVIPIEIDFLDRFNITLPADIKMDTSVGDVEIHQDGRIVFGGHGAYRGPRCIGCASFTHTAR